LQLNNNWTSNPGGTNTVYLSNSGFTNQNIAPEQIITTNSSSLTPGANIGLDLHNSNTTAGAYAPLLVFSKTETGATAYNSAIAAIGARTVSGTGASGSWIDGDLMFYTAPTAGSGLLERMRIDQAGNVGIGTTNPVSSLQIGSQNSVTTSTPSTLSLGGTYSDTAGANLKLKLYDGGSIYGLGVSASSLDSSVPTGAGFNWYINNSKVVSINSSGNVGIGSATPAAKLDLPAGFFRSLGGTVSGLGSAGNVVVMADNSGNLFSTTTASIMPQGTVSLPGGTSGQTLRYSGSAWIANSTLYNNGSSIGIGTTTPLASLHIVMNTGMAQLKLERTGSRIGSAVLGAGDSGLLFMDSSYDPKLYIGTAGTYNGSVGVGTTTPGSKLTVAGDIRHTGSLVSQGTNYASSWMKFDQDVNGNSLILGAGGLTAIGAGESADLVRGNIPAATETLYLASDNGISFQTNLQSSWAASVNAMNITSAGNVGIGSATPAAKLDLPTGFFRALGGTVSGLGAAGNVVVMADNSGNLFATSSSSFISNNSLDLWAGSKTGNIYANNSGRVGIGTTNPQYLLHVGGTIYSTGDLILNNNSYPRNVIDYEYDNLFAADKKYTVTATGFSDVANMFDGRQETVATCSALPCSVLIDMGSIRHYWYAFSLAYSWGTGYAGSSNFKIEKYHDPDGTGGCDTWTTVSDVTGFSGSKYFTQGNLDNYICRFRITFNDIVGSQNNIQLGEIAGYQFFSGNSGPSVKRYGDSMYGSLNFQNVSNDITTVTN